MASEKVKTIRKIRIYQSDKEGRLRPVGGLRKNRIIVVDDTERTFSNAPSAALRVLNLEASNFFVLKSDKNFLPAPKNAPLNPTSSDAGISAFTKPKFVAADAMDYKTPEQFYCADGEWDFHYDTGSKTFSYGGYEFNGKERDYNLGQEFDIPSDSLVDEIYVTVNADGYMNADADGYLTPAEIAKLSKKGKKRYKQALRISKKGSNAQSKQGDAALNKALAKTVDQGAKDAGSDSMPAFSLPPIGGPAQGAAQAKLLGMPQTTAIIVIVGGVLLLGGLVVMLSGGGSKPRAAAPAPASPSAPAV